MPTTTWTLDANFANIARAYVGGGAVHAQAAPDFSNSGFGSQTGQGSNTGNGWTGDCTQNDADFYAKVASNKASIYSDAAVTNTKRVAYYHALQNSKAYTDNLKARFAIQWTVAASGVQWGWFNTSGDAMAGRIVLIQNLNVLYLFIRTDAGAEGHSYATSKYTAANDTPYYVELEFVASTHVLTAKIYTDSAYSSLAATLTYDSGASHTITMPNFGVMSFGPSGTGYSVGKTDLWAVAIDGETAEALVNDSGQTYMDAGSGNYWDNTTATETVSGTLAVKHKIADYAANQSFADAAAVEAGASWSVAWQTQAELRGTANSELRYRYQKVQLSVTYASGNASLTSYACDTGAVDITPPAVPSGTKYIEVGSATSIYGLDWTDPADADFDHCELRKTVGGTEYYLAKATSLPSWGTSSSPAAWWTLAAEDAAQDTPVSGWLDDSGDTATAYYVRSVDALDNKSAWTELTLQTSADLDDVLKSAGGNYNDDNLSAGNVKLSIAFGLSQTGTYDPTGSPPSAPSISAATASTGQVALTLVAAAETDVLYVRYRQVPGSGAWSAESETWKRTGSGAVTITGLADLVEYEFSAYAKASALTSAWCKPVYATPNTGETTYRRDSIALALYRVAQRQGVQLTLDNGTEDAITVWAVVSPVERQLGRSRGETDIERLTLTIPRQTAFPPSTWQPGATITLHSKVYEIETANADNGDDAMASSWVVEAFRFRGHHVETGQ